LGREGGSLRPILPEACFVLLLAAFAVWAPPPSVPAAVLTMLLLALAFVPALSRPAGEGRLRRDRVLVLVCWFLLSTSVRFLPEAGLTGWWPAAGASLILLGGLYVALRDRFPFSRMRREATLAAVVLILASGAVAGMLRGVLAFRSTRAIAPGSVDFLLCLPVWLAAWFGLDAVLRGAPGSQKPGVVFWLFDHRHPLGLAVCLLIILVRAA
jgi:hypothetical protein